MKFLDGLDHDLKTNLLAELRILWTHASTAIEGNTLTLGETEFVLSEGLTIKGKPLKDHQDVTGHAQALDLAMALLGQEAISERDLFDLHKLVMTGGEFDHYKPIGAWKNANNSTKIIKDGKLDFLDFSNFWEVPELMARWIALFNAKYQEVLTWDQAKQAYIDLHVSFVAIHPFWDGNGRVARIVANLPVLRLGHPPIVIESALREDYIFALRHYTNLNGVPAKDSPLIIPGPGLEPFTEVVEKSLGASRELVAKAQRLQEKRSGRSDG
jgi:Fic family protein